MKRHSLWSTALASLAVLAAAIPAQAQVGMATNNGWSFAFSGNINAFAVYEKASTDGTSPQLLVIPGAKGFDIRTGMLPAMATFSAKGRDGGRDLGAVFTLAPEIQCAGGSVTSANLGGCTGSQLDVRQVYMTVGGVHGGSLLAGRDLGLFGRGAIMNDMTMFGTGQTGGPGGGGTTLGRFGTGYNYPNYTAQMTWSSAAGKSTQFSIGLFDPTSFATFTETQTPRVEARWTMNSSSHNVWLEGLLQSAKDPGADQTLTSAGGAGGIKWWNNKVTLVGTAFYGSGIGTIANFIGGVANAGPDANTTVGGYAQAMFVMNPRTDLGVSYGLNQLQLANSGPKFTASSFTAGLYNKYSRSLRSTLEATYASDGDDASGDKNNTGITISAGLLLFW